MRENMLRGNVVSSTRSLPSVDVSGRNIFVGTSSVRRPLFASAKVLRRKTCLLECLLFDERCSLRLTSYVVIVMLSKPMPQKFHTVDDAARMVFSVESVVSQYLLLRVGCDILRLVAGGGVGLRYKIPRTPIWPLKSRERTGIFPVLFCSLTFFFRDPAS